MIGFEIKINDIETIFAAADGSVCLHIGFGNSNENDYLTIRGVDSQFNNITWDKIKLSIGDKIKIKVVEIKEISPIKTSRLSDRNQLKDRYYALKAELGNKGII